MRYFPKTLDFFLLAGGIVQRLYAAYHLEIRCSKAKHDLLHPHSTPFLIYCKLPLQLESRRQIAQYLGLSQPQFGNW